MSTAVEQVGSRELSKDSKGKLTGSRTFLVYDDSGTLTVDDVFDTVGLPTIGQPHPDSDSIVAISYSLRYHADRVATYVVTYSYGVMDYDHSNEDATEEDNSDVDQDTAQAFSIRVGLSIIDIWKSEPDMPSNKDTPARTDIGGTLVSEGGYPISMALPIAELTLSQKISGFYNASAHLAKVGLRNSSEWQGFEAGSVLFTGVDVTQDQSGNNDISYQLTYDKNYHLRQVPERDEDGNPKVSLASDPPTLNVFFKQPFKQTTDFGFLPSYG